MTKTFEDVLLHVTKKFERTLIWSNCLSKRHEIHKAANQVLDLGLVPIRTDRADHHILLSAPLSEKDVEPSKHRGKQSGSFRRA